MSTLKIHARAERSDYIHAIPREARGASIARIMIQRAHVRRVRIHTQYRAAAYTLTVIAYRRRGLLLLIMRGVVRQRDSKPVVAHFSVLHPLSNTERRQRVKEESENDGRTKVDANESARSRVTTRVHIPHIRRLEITGRYCTRRPRVARPGPARRRYRCTGQTARSGE